MFAKVELTFKWGEVHLNPPNPPAYGPEIIASASTKVEKCEDKFDISVSSPKNDTPELSELKEVKNLSANQKGTVIAK